MTKILCLFKFQTKKYMNLKKIEKKLLTQRVTGEPNFLKRIKKIDRKSVYSFLKIVDNYCRMSRIIVE